MNPNISPHAASLAAPLALPFGAAPQPIQRLPINE